MLGLISAESVQGRRCAFSLSAPEPLGMGCLWAQVQIGQRARDRRVGRCLLACAQRLEALRARRVVFAEGFPYRPFFLERGFAEAGCEELLAQKAGEIAAAGAAGHERALLSTPRADGPSVRAVRELVRRFRYLLIDAPEGTFEILEEVCGEYGVTPERMGPGRFADVDAAVFMSRPARPVYASARCAALFVRGGRELMLGGREIAQASFTLPARRAFQLPFPAAPILSAALSCGRIAPSDVQVTAAGNGISHKSGASLDKTGKNLYNV